MPRRGNVPKREILPDPMYNSVLVTKLVNSIMLDGKKGVAQKVVYGAFDIIKEKTEKDPLDVFTTALENIMPSLEVKARRVGGATYQVPIEVRPERRQTLGLRWLTTYARARSEKTMKERLAGDAVPTPHLRLDRHHRSSAVSHRLLRLCQRLCRCKHRSVGGKRDCRDAPIRHPTLRRCRRQSEQQGPVPVVRTDSRDLKRPPNYKTTKV